jgi:hypothetical protein
MMMILEVEVSGAVKASDTQPLGWRWPEYRREAESEQFGLTH